jgi:hypothetical protein
MVFLIGAHALQGIGADGTFALAPGVPVSLMVPDLSPIQQLTRAETGEGPSAAPPGEFP